MSDLIDRQAAIKETWKDPSYYDPLNVLTEVRDRLKALPSVGPKWIPCSERLPDEARHYLCSFEEPLRIDRIHVDLAYWTGGQWYGYKADAIIAWMPLPDPWKGEEECC